MDNFNDLENDIAGDWLAIQEKIREEEGIEKEKNNPKKLYCTYERFYKLICECYYDGIDLNRSMALHEIMHRVICSNESMPDGFERVWNVFCNSHEHNVSKIECMSCGELYNITYKRTIVRPLSVYDMGDGYADTMIRPRQDAIYCPKCSRVLARLDSGTFISLTISKIHEDRINMEERSNDIKYKF